MQTFTAIFENGVFKPTEPLNLAEHTQVRLTFEPPKKEMTKEERLAALAGLMQIIKPHPGEHLTRDQLHERR
jgi:predicted DNA-binding antitoxin AbrB/MazE fold protein